MSYKPVNYLASAVGEANNEKLMVDLNYKSPSYQSMYQNFDRFYSVYPEIELTDLKHYIFITRPELNVVNIGNPAFVSSTCSKDSWMKYMARDHNIVLRHLTLTLDPDHDFMPFLVGRTESIQIPDYSLKNQSVSQPYSNYLMPYATNANESRTGGTFDIVFKEEYQLRVHKLFYTWMYYIDAVNKGLFKPLHKFLIYNKFDYMCSVYHIVTRADGETIVWWSKYTGCVPINIPNSDMSFNLRGGTENKIPITFSYFMHEALNPEILLDFNQNSRAAATSYVPLYDEELFSTGNALVGAPFIHRRNSESYAYYLRWRSPKKF